MVGATRTGKSHLARSIFLSTQAPRLIIDPADSSLTDLRGAVTFHDPGTATNPQGIRWTTAATARFVPDDPDDLDAYDRVYRWAFDRFPRWIWCDEAGAVMPAAGYPRAANRYIVQGAKRRLGHLACHTRPRELARNLIAQAQHVFVFDLPNPDDRAHIAKIAGIDGPVLDREMAALQVHGFLWWQQRDRTLTRCPPLDR